MAERVRVRVRKEKEKQTKDHIQTDFAAAYPRFVSRCRVWRIQSIQNDQCGR